ncbi:hypothetical protein BT96DRAFT_954710 [Gymnopus androsaceus JB14]|uniref:VWFA domain-containing protein n=1 Tax=Gymnopus androsaceus JB14 TaxID=1447944 RepID=A0A6A4ICS0_9AGAR|nr:hypothetical protein BT96DRAFT_954710 [Gymnopus androsaceus JB14]
MYRILDLISESGSGELIVDKIIIAQDSLKQFINEVVPGAYTSLTKVDFKALDKVGVKPFGVYGSKAQIIELLYSVGSVDDKLARLLTSSSDDSTGPRLRSGLYFIRISPSPENVERVIVLYWPEDTTWDDNAISSVRRNRVTFMRYLSKIADQTMCLVSEKHAKAIVWSESSSEDSVDELDDDENDRLFTFEVAKTKEQEESVKSRPGIRMAISLFKTTLPSPDCPLDTTAMTPKIIPGETQQGVLTTNFVPPTTHKDFIRDEIFNKTALKSLLRENHALTLGNDLTEASIRILAENGMERLFPTEFQGWRDRATSIRKDIASQNNVQRAELDAKIEGMMKTTRMSIREALLKRVTSVYPTLDFSELLKDDDVSDADTGSDHKFASLVRLYPAIGSKFEELMSIENISKITSQTFRPQKLRLIMVQSLLDVADGISDANRKSSIDAILTDGDLKNLQSHWKEPSKSTLWKKMMQFVSISTSEPLEEKIMKIANQKIKETSDPSFLVGLKDLLEQDAGLENVISSTIKSAQSILTHTVQKNFEILVKVADTTQQKKLRESIEQQSTAEEAKLLHEDILVVEAVEAIQSASIYCEQLSSSLSLYIQFSNDAFKAQSFRVGGVRRRRTEPLFEYKIQPVTLTADDTQNLRLNKHFIPTPKVETRTATSFKLPTHYSVRHIQLLANGKCLLVIDTGREFRVVCESPPGLDHAIKRMTKLGKDVLVAFDESTRLLAIIACESDKVCVFPLGFAFTSLRASDTVNLVQWYPPATSIRLSCFICGSEELLLVDSMCHLRIFSLMTQQFRPATIELDRAPVKAMSSPDYKYGFSVRSYHWSTFGSSEGTSLDLNVPGDPVVTAFDNRNSPHLVWIDIAAQMCQSVALDITKRVTEFSFQEKGTRSSRNSSEQSTIHNALIDCHADVWTRFPVVPAISRQTLVTKERRLPNRLLFVTDLNQEKFDPYFATMIHSFEQRTRKPGSDVLRKIQVDCASFDDVLQELVEESDWDVSELRVGEWLVDVLCLIPIHLAVTRDNRFIPLKDGVSSSALEKSLLGANVSQIVDMLSVGWYESIFQSYQATKVCEQSVGKSFALNHLADTSFAGSAMRTTEGVWMSVTPTESALIVALDFEGVHSIERSSQEDALLVLFNTSISNLVRSFPEQFCTFARYRWMFQSFQSSSTVLDPKANPTLFQSTLVIIIKDVVESDKSEIKIVQDEQDANFISRLHAGRLNIIPWPVIESKQFYTLYPVLKGRLDKQVITHPTAGEFLQTLKTMMAKLKANDWGALSQTLAGHRASQLMEALPYALTYGYTDIEKEPLKNMDTNKVIEVTDTPAIFYIPGSSFTSEWALSTLLESWTDIGERNRTQNDRTWIEGLQQYILSLADQRIEHVRQWIDSNLGRFKTDHANVEALRRMLESTVIAMRSHVELCMMKCESCNLLCICSRRHDSKDPHHCNTNHKCTQSCEFVDGHEEEEDEKVPCGFAAGHTGKHICTVDTHLCGEKCDLHDKKGCLEECIKVTDHADEGHFCASRTHACGEPCDLAHVNLEDGTTYSCPGTCHHPSDLEHSEHACDNRFCPLLCQLCARLCCGKHLHGLDMDAVHLCGEQHLCAALCAAPGICDIETQPQSIEATFTGRHETFQYTKVSAKRLQCVIPIPAGNLEHQGAHTHSSARNAFHYCEARCEDCGYYCTLPRGHPQQLHETSHGSMSKTSWALDDPDDAVELTGRKFGTGDDGAPMLCNIVCTDMGRHVHVGYCRASPGQPCQPTEGVQHVTHPMLPNRDQPKDWVTHNLHWGRMDPYSQEDRANFAKCDAMCSGPEHAATTTGPAQPSYCILPLFHPPAAFNNAGMGYISNDGHHFSCKNPVQLQQAYHVIFIIDRSGSMDGSDHRPLANTPTTALITRNCNNRLGAAYSALYGFWTSRNAALSASGQQGARRDAYSVILFDHNVNTCITNDFSRNPDELLNAIIPFKAGGGTDYTSALNTARAVMTQHWSTERSPVIIFLSDGECAVADSTVQGLCREAVVLGKALSFHTVAFGPHNSTLKRMAQIALEVQNRAPRDPLLPATAYIESSYAEVLDTVRLAETFLGLADSLKKTRGALLR